MLALLKTVPNTAYISWGILTLFSLLQFFLQVNTGLMTEGLMQDFSLTTTGVGIFSSLFFYTYIAAQLPAGFLFARYPTHQLVAITASVCALGCVLFALATDRYLACFGRILMGFGAGFGFLGLLHVTRVSFPRTVFAVMVGLSELIAMLGTGVGEHLTGAFITAIGWRTIMMLCAAVAALTAMLAFVLIHPPSAEQRIAASQQPAIRLRESIQLLLKPSIWCAGFYGFGLLAVMTAFSALWGADFLRSVYGLEFVAATQALSLLFWGLALGCPLLGYCASHGSLSWVMRISALIALILMIGLIFPLWPYDLWIIKTLLFSLGFVSGAYFLCFDAVTRDLPLALHNAGMSLCSVMVMSSAIILQPLMGLIIAHPFVFSGFQDAMLLLVFFQWIAFLATF